ncbi:MAG: 16S rRNA (cytidine(1402)-2'-O)-methyltransferase [Nitrospirae bacterium]|nr:16S rRNA (cytidine(1402)-2'-O)-methyltransferase [Nitrospirota bacterium]
MAGLLYIVSVPIGNAEDITLRALRILKEVTVVAAEDTQRTKALFEHHAIDTPLTSYHTLNKEEKAPVLIRRLQEGHSVALVSDAGTPVISDPGYFLVRRALASGIRVVPVPGPSAVLAALPASGLPCDAFVFLGMLPRTGDSRRRLLETVRSEPRTLVLFESPGRLPSTLKELHAVLGHRQIVLARELTKPGEEFIRGIPIEVLKTTAVRPLSGDITLLVEGVQGRRRQGRTGGRKNPTRRRASGS